MFQPHADRIAKPLLAIASFACTTMLALIIAVIIIGAWPALSSHDSIAFITDKSWYPLEGQFGMLSMLLASVLVMIIAILLAAPIGIMCAIFIAYIAPARIQKGYRFAIALLAGMPSVVLGLWGLTVLVPLINKWSPPGQSLLLAGIVLCIMILPTVTLTSLAAFKSLPETLQHATSALGIRQHVQIVNVLIPAASAAIISGVLLAMARALGETMVVLMVAGNVVQFPTGLLEPVRTLTANIALEMAYATDLHRASLFVSGLILTVLVLVMMLIASKIKSDNHYG
ncbi:MAG: phosphate ABC transporter permease subunit PstC [Gammaproteobacteria bacterium]|nr:phosphate ABC transporter permease subunit PstC [Gammaproteobacteria bacterium]